MRRAGRYDWQRGESHYARKHCMLSQEPGALRRTQHSKSVTKIAAFLVAATGFIQLFLIVLHLTPAVASGVFAPEPVSSFTLYPDLPLDGFVSGKLGIIQPTYARSYLAVAYRYLNGHPPDKSDRKQMLELWNNRLGTPSAIVTSPPGDESESEETDGLADWLATRKTVPGAKPLKDIDTWSDYKTDQYFDTFVNCQNDAFANASKVLTARIKKFGSSSNEVKEWLTAQDQVFCNCHVDPGPYRKPNSAPKGPFLPAEAQPAAPEIIQQDRQYQLACSYFYASKFDQSEKIFMAIAADPKSPWRKLGPYLAARSLIRKSSLQKNDKDPALLIRAQQLLTPISKDPAAGGLRTDSIKLLRTIRCRQRRLAELSKLFQTERGENFYKAADDLTMTMDIALPDNPDDFKKIPQTILQDDLVDWTITCQFVDNAAYEHAVARWKNRGGIPWLVACISKAVAGDPDLEKVVTETSKIDSTSPAYLTASYHLIRIWIETQRIELARKRLDSVLAMPLPITTRNSFLEEQARVVRNINELAGDCVLIPAGVMTCDQETPEWYQSGTPPVHPPAMFDPGTIDLINSKLPLSVLKQLALNKNLPTHLKADALKAVWVRAVLLGNETIAAEVSNPLIKVRPQMSAVLTAFNTAKSPDERRYASTLAILKYPGLRPYFTRGSMRERAIDQMDTYSDNWWTDPTGDYYRDEVSAEKLNRGRLPELGFPPFLTFDERKQAEAEVKTLKNLGCSANYLAKITVDWAKRARQDPRVPEALHRAVMVTRYGGTDDNTSAFSKQAFQLLHKNYPGSKWAKETKFYF